MTRPIRNFWPSLESVVGLSAVQAEWARLLGDELPWAVGTRLLRCSGTRAGYYPRGGDAAPSLLPYEVVEHGEDDYVGVCPDGWETVPLTRGQLLLWELDRMRLAEAVAAALSLPKSFEPDVHPFTSRVGTYGSGGGAVPVYLTIGIERDDLTAAARAGRVA
jgi:hypothetical protein